MPKVHLLWFVQQDDEILIGVSETESANNAIERLKSKPGFLDFPQAFEIHSYELGKDHWTEGFIRD